MTFDRYDMEILPKWNNCFVYACIKGWSGDQVLYVKTFTKLQKCNTVGLQSFSLHIVQIALVDKEEPLLNRTINQSFKSIKASNPSVNKLLSSSKTLPSGRWLPFTCPRPHTGALYRHCLNTMLNKVCWIPNIKLDLILATLNSCHASLTPNYPLLQWI